MSDKSKTTDPLEEMARRAVSFAPFCGPSPNSNRWADIALSKRSGEPLDVDGEAIAIAVQRGWLLAERLDVPGYTIPEDDGPWEMMWRYYAADKFRPNAKPLAK